MQRKSPAFYNKSSLAIVASGIAGFIVGVWILLGFNLNGCDRFQEIGFHPSSLEFTFLDSMRSRIQQARKFQLDVKTWLIRKGKFTDTAAVNKKLDSLDLIARKVDTRQVLAVYGNKDTLLDNKVKFSANRDSLWAMLLGINKTDTLTFSYYDSTLSPVIVRRRVPFELNPVSTSMRFFSRYPSFAAWTFLGILQSTLWFLAAAISIILLMLTAKKPEAPASTKPANDDFNDSKSRWKSVIVSVIAVGIFCTILYFFIIDKLIVRDAYFMNGFTGVMVPYAIIGYLVAALCFTGYLNIADHIFYIQNCLSVGARKMMGIKATMSKDAAEPASQQSQQQDNDEVRTSYSVAKRNFNIYFFMTAMILSILVLWLGSLFTAVNNMDLMKYYKLISGQMFLPNDFVYLFGALHSLLLLIFFIPVKLNMFSLNSLIPNSEKPEQQEQQAGTWQNLWKSLGRSMSDVLVVSSPFLASLIHQLFAN
jgi:hypothetical protein